MLNLLKIILAFFSFLLFLLLIQISFFSGNNISNSYLDSLLSIKNNEIELSWTWDLNYKQINFLDNLYFSKEDSIEIKELWDNIEFIVWEGVFIFDLNDLTKNYFLKSSWFSIKLKSSWNFYIDTRSSNILIFSINSSFLIDFLDNKDKKINSYFIYPHEFIKFNTKLNFRYKKVDLYRIRTITKNWYFPYSLDSENIEKLYSIIWSENKELLNLYLKNKKDLIESNNSLYWNVSNLSNLNFPFKEYIDEYMIYFVNDSKKVVYLQNNVYNNLLNLFNSNIINYELIDNINNDLNKLKTLDSNSYENSINIIDQIYKSIIIRNDLKSDVKLTNFLLLKNKGLNFSSIKNYVFLKEIYYSYDFLSWENMIYNFKLFLSSYLKNSWIVQKNENLSLNTQEKLFEIESFVFFLKSYIDSNLFISSYSKFESEIEILSKYIDLSKMIYFSDKWDSEKIRTSLQENKDLLLKLEKYLKSNFFEEKRTDNWFLKLVNLNNFDERLLFSFKKEVDKLFNMYLSNKDLLIKEKKNELTKEYDEIILLFEEYFLALSDYEKYQFESWLSDLYWDTDPLNNTDKEYSIKDIGNYLSWFYWLSYNYSNIKEKKDYFEIKNVIIHSKNYKLHLYPYTWNRLNIYDYFNDKLLYSYNLDDIELLLKDKWSEDNEYNFKYFIYEKLKNINYTNNSQNDDSNEYCKKWQIPDWTWWCKKQDSDAVRVFKRDKLIWEEFSLIKDFFNVKYNKDIDNLDVVIDWSNVDIKLNNVETIISLWNQESKKTYTIYFFSDYDLKNHLFENISFKIKKWSWNNSSEFLFNGRLINLGNKKVELLKLKEFLENYLENNLNL